MKPDNPTCALRGQCVYFGTHWSPHASMPSKVKVSAWVPQDLRSQWEHVFGEYGSLSWLIETAMREMLAEVSHLPTKEAIIRRAIRQFVSDLAAEREAKRVASNQPTHGNNEQSPADSRAAI